MNIIKGEHLMLFLRQGDLDGTASNTMIPLAHATSCQIQLNTDSFSTTSKDTGSWETSAPGMRSWEASSDNLYTPVWDKLFTLWVNRVIFPIYWCPANNTEYNDEVTHTPSLTVDGNTYKLYTGNVYITNLNGTANNNEASNVSITLKGTGKFTQTNTLPSTGIGVSQSNVSIVQDRDANIMVIGATGTITATCDETKVIPTVVNGVVNIKVDAACPVGAYIVAVADSGTSSTVYVFVTVTAST